MASTVHDPILQAFELSDTTVSNFILLLLKDDSFREHACTKDLIAHSTHILDAFLSHPKSSKSAWDWANNFFKQNYAASIRELADKDNGWHFNALHASQYKLQEFQVEDMAKNMQQLAPELWDMLGLMLSANRREMRHARSFDRDADQVMKAAEDDNDDEEYWMELEGLYVEADEDEVEATIPKRHDPQQMAKRCDALITIVCNFLITPNYAIHKESQKKWLLLVS